MGGSEEGRLGIGPGHRIGGSNVALEHNVSIAPNLPGALSHLLGHLLLRILDLLVMLRY